MSATRKWDNHQAPAGRFWSKLAKHQLERKAIVYVRQSTLHQLKNNPESTRLQRELVKQVAQMGFCSSQIELLDEDQGKSAASTEGRSGFLRLQNQVRQGRVGLVMSWDVSRLCRSSLDWQYLVRLCEHNETLLGDQDGVYDPQEPNDRLLLGLKGAMSEFELYVLHQRMERGKQAKAARGELRLAAPRGYVNGKKGQLLKDPDQRVRARVQLCFEMFQRKGSVYGVVQFLRQNALKLPYREPGAAGYGEVSWTEPTAESLGRMLKNPLYTGAYVYGRHRVEKRKKKPGKPWSGLVKLPKEQWMVHLPHRHEAYISPEQFELNQRSLYNNRPKGLGAPRQGKSLLAGLVFCGHCQKRMQVSYKNNGGGLRYHCISEQIRLGAPRCQTLAGGQLESEVEQLVLEALEPASLCLSFLALQELSREQSLLQKAWQQRLEQARYEARLAEKSYKAVDPQNRLVALTLETQWEEALSQLKRLEEEFLHFQEQKDKQLSPQQRQKLLELCRDIPALWHGNLTPMKHKQRLVRILIDRLEVSIEQNSEKLSVLIHWAGGDCTLLPLCRTVSRYEQLSFYPKMLGRIELLTKQGQSDEQIASTLRAEGFHCPQKKALSSLSVARLRRRHGLYRPRLHQRRQL